MSNLTRVAVHPIVLLSIADHHNRVAPTTNTQRVIGILLGDEFQGCVNVLQSFAVPFDEETSDSQVLFIDSSFIYEMYELVRKVNLKERIVGWYSSKSTISGNDLQIHQSMRRYTPDPIFITTDVQAQDPNEIPVRAYIVSERVRTDGRPLLASFESLATSIEFLEVEEIAVEHLLRDTKDVDISEIGQTLTNSAHGLAALEERLRYISDYLALVIEGKLPVDNEIIGLTQAIFNLLPNLRLKDTTKALATESDDAAFMVFTSQLVRSVVTLHDLVNLRHPPVVPEDKAKVKAQK